MPFATTPSQPFVNGDAADARYAGSRLGGGGGGGGGGGDIGIELLFDEPPPQATRSAVSAEMPTNPSRRDAFMPCPGGRKPRLQGSAFPIPRMGCRSSSGQ